MIFILAFALGGAIAFANNAEGDKKEAPKKETKSEKTTDKTSKSTKAAEDDALYCEVELPGGGKARCYLCDCSKLVEAAK